MKKVFTLFLTVLFFSALSCERKSNEFSPNSNQSAANVETTSEAKISFARNTIFEKNLPENLSLSAVDENVSRRILKDYGAVFVAQGDVILPPKVLFENAEECAKWQAQVSTEKDFFGAVNIELQTAAMNALKTAREEMRGKGLNITARGTWGAKRDYEDTEEIWQTRFKPALQYWTNRGKIPASEAARIRSLAPAKQVAEVLRLEEKGFYFSKDFSKSVLYSATPPGASQHLLMLALDVNENANPNVRSILAKHGWFQTVLSDVPHFTYLGTNEENLPALGLKKVLENGRTFWIPN